MLAARLQVLQERGRPESAVEIVAVKAELAEKRRGARAMRAVKWVYAYVGERRPPGDMRGNWLGHLIYAQMTPRGDDVTVVRRFSGAQLDPDGEGRQYMM